MQERRKWIRRQADRALLENARSQRSASSHEEDNAARHMRRRVIRHHCQVRIRMKIRYSNGRDDTWSVTEHPIAGRLLDLSETGCSIFTKEQLEMGQELMLGLVLPDSKPIDVSGTVRWVKLVPDKGGCAHGAEFSGLTAAGRKAIEAFLKHLDETVGL